MSTLSEVSLAYRASRPVDSLPTITSPEEAVAYLREIWDDDKLELQEEFIILLLDPAKHCLGHSRISAGGSTATIVEPAAIFQTALLGKAHSIIAAHNHPSGNLKASSADIQLTKRISEAGKLLGITLDDHIILTRGGFTSLRNEGLI